MFEPQELRILSWNADGVRSKRHELMDLAVSTLRADVISLCETRLSLKSQLNFPGFAFYRQDKHTNGRGQGVAILIKDNIHHSVVDIPKIENIEAIAIKIILSGIDHIIVSIYQSPNLPLLANDLNKLFGLGPRVLLVGDFNANHDHWIKGTNNAHGRMLFLHMLNHDYVIHASSSPTLTHYRANHTPTNPNLALALNINKLSNISAVPALSSNHLPIFFTIGGSPCLKPPKPFFRYDVADWARYRAFIDENLTLTSKVFKTESEIDEAILFFHQTIMKARDLCVPLGVKNDYQEYKLPRYIKKLIREKNNLRRKDLYSLDLNAKRRTRARINVLNTEIQHSIRKHYDRIWNNKLAKVDNPSSDIWRIAKSLRSKPTVIPSLISPDGTVASTVSEQSEMLADSFYANMNLTLSWTDDKVLAKVEQSIAKLDSFNETELELPTRPKHIWKFLRNLKRRKSPGDDNIHNALLKNLSQKAVVYLTKIFNGCLCLNYFPKVWKFAKVIAIKKPSKDEKTPSSYRPISLLPALGKLFESIIYSRLMQVTKHLLKNEQFGFRGCHSTTQQLARVAEHISHNLNLKQSTGMILLDIEKAFDTVWHDGLIHKLIQCDIPLGLVKLIKSYLINREFSVSIGDNTKSTPRLVPAGIPQGSILGPYLFLLYVNDIPIQTRTSLACFADDTASFTSAKDTGLIVDRLQLSLDSLREYFTRWKLKLNEAKTEAIIFSRQRQEPAKLLKIGDHTIPWSKSVRYLGVTLDKRLNWTKHCSTIRNKGVTAMNSLSPILNRRSNLSATSKLRIYKTLVRPCLSYAAPVWSSTCSTNYDALQVIQNKAVKIAFNTPFYTNLRNLHIKIKLPLLREFILRLTRKFYDSNSCHTNSLVSSIGKTNINELPYIDTYGTYRLPHHYAATGLAGR
ncbi:hypothetical protein JYU34_017831 [Plutella xylostella]|uniref:Reverse transcriptase domain-containing protein n=1 Tax=Plutella xylostella TaxID=51655 RepID=A0ABQ7Q288_PLUXY|nr:hypothetical protein JYU34_017831 [Plutella xylostella]